MVQARDGWLPARSPSLVPVAQAIVERERTRHGEGDAALPLIRKAADRLHRDGRHGWDVFVTGTLVATLLERGAEGDLAEAQEMIDRLANLRPAQDWAVRDIMLLQLRALLARTRHDDVAYRELVGRYRAMAESLGYEGHIAWAEAMIEGGQ